MCNVAEQLFEAIKQKFSCEHDKRIKEKFNVMLRKNKNYTIASANIEVKQEYIENVFDDLCTLAENKLKNIKGEIQAFEIKKGENVDLGVRQAEIIKGKFFEVYCYECMSVIFLRIWLENLLFINKKWLSIDCDEIQNTLWFKEES